MIRNIIYGTIALALLFIAYCAVMVTYFLIAHTDPPPPRTVHITIESSGR